MVMIYTGKSLRDKFGKPWTKPTKFLHALEGAETLAREGAGPRGGSQTGKKEVGLDICARMRGWTKSCGSWKQTSKLPFFFKKALKCWLNNYLETWPGASNRMGWGGGSSQAFSVMPLASQLWPTRPHPAHRTSYPLPSSQKAVSQCVSWDDQTPTARSTIMTSLQTTF